VPEPGAAATVFGRLLATMVVDPLLRRTRGRVIGAPERVRLERLCAEVLDEVVRDSVGDEHADHVLSVLQRAFDATEQERLALDAVEDRLRVFMDMGGDPETLPVDLDLLLGRVLTLLPERIRTDAVKPESPLFRWVTVEQLDILGKQIAKAVPLDPALRRRLDGARDDCRARDVRFRTPHLLLALLEGSSAGQRCFDAVSSGMAEKLMSELKKYVECGSFENYAEFSWSQDPTIREARFLAMQEGVEQVSDVHVLLALLKADPPSTTVADLRRTLGPEKFAELVAGVEAAPRKVRRTATPGPVLDDSWTV